MLPQEHLTERVRALCRADDDLVAALTYGSFPQGTGDEFSDIEFWLFRRPGAVLAPRAWLDRVGEVRHVVVNEFGTHVAFFRAADDAGATGPGRPARSTGLIRGEFHFAADGEIATVAQWPARSAPVDRMILVDRTGALRHALDSLPGHVRVPGDGPEVEELCGRFANWLLLAHHVTARGELLRAADTLGHVQRHLLWMSRLAAGQTRTWLTPSRRAESDLGEQVVRALTGVAFPAPPASTAASASTSAPVVSSGGPAVPEVLAAAWRLGRELWTELAARTGHPLPHKLFADFDALFAPAGADADPPAAPPLRVR